MGGLRWGVESICDVLTQHGVTIMTRWQTQRKILGARKLWRIEDQALEDYIQRQLASTRAMVAAGWGEDEEV